MGLADDDRVGKIAHELGNVIGAVLNYGLLASRHHLPDGAVEDLARLGSAAERAAELVRELAQYAQPPVSTDRTHGADGADDG